MFKKTLVMFLTAFLVACSLAPKKFTSEELVEFGNKEISDYYNIQKKPAHVMDIHEVSARVLKYNLSRQLHEIELSLSEARLGEYKSKMLPQVGLSSTMTNRNKDNILTESTVASDGTVSSTASNATINSDKSITRNQLEVSWNTLDFGLSYLVAQQKADAILVARERRRKAIFNLLEKAHEAYWFVVSGQKYEHLTLNILKEIDKTLEKLSVVSIDNSPKKSLVRQRDLLKNKRNVNNYLRSIKQKKIELADLMGLPAGTSYTVYAHNEKLPIINMSRTQMDEFLFANHPDMRIAAYNESISLKESKKALYRLFPTLSAEVGVASTTNSYATNQNYSYTGTTVAWNLLNALEIGKRNEMNDLEELFARDKRIASGVSVLTSARIKELLYQDTLSRYADDVNLHMIEKRISKAVLVRGKPNIADRINMIESQIAELESGIARVKSYSRLAGYALSIASVTSGSDFEYDLNRISLSALKYNLKLELGRMPISWIRQNDKYSIPSRVVESQVDKVFKLWRTEQVRGVKEGGDNMFIPNRLPASSLGNYAEPELKSAHKKEVKIKKNEKVKKPVIKLIKPAPTSDSTTKRVAPTANEIVKPNMSKTTMPAITSGTVKIDSEPLDAIKSDIYKLLKRLEDQEKMQNN